MVNESAVRSLEKGLEETLTIHRLGLIEKLGRSFKTTNCLESIMAPIGQKTDKVDYWKNSNQKQTVQIYHQTSTKKHKHFLSDNLRSV